MARGARSRSIAAFPAAASEGDPNGATNPAGGGAALRVAVVTAGPSRSCTAQRLIVIRATDIRRPRE